MEQIPAPDKGSASGQAAPRYPAHHQRGGHREPFRLFQTYKYTAMKPRSKTAGADNLNQDKKHDPRHAERDVQVIQRLAGRRVFLREVLTEGLGARDAHGGGFPASHGTAEESLGPTLFETATDTNPRENLSPLPSVLCARFLVLCYIFPSRQSHSKERERRVVSGGKKYRARIA